jgi:hypothetical protein
LNSYAKSHRQSLNSWAVFIGDRAKDFQAADKLAGVDQDYREKHMLLWHHREDVVQSADEVACRMELIPHNSHDSVRQSVDVILRD